MSKKILFISYNGLTDPLGQSQILPYYKGLSAKGYEITLLSCEKEEVFKEGSALVQQQCEAWNINWEYTFYKNNFPVLSTISNVNRLKKKAFEIAQKNSFDIFHCRSIIPAIIGHSLKEKLGGKLIFDIRGFWADERVEGGLWNIKNPVYKKIYSYFKKKEKLLFAESDYIVTLTENSKKYIADNFTTKNNFQVVPCCADLDHFNTNNYKDASILELKKELGIKEEEYVLTYLGSLGTRYMLREMLLFFRQLKKLKENSKFLFITKSDTSQMESLCEELDVDYNDIVIISSAYSEIPKYILVGDASIFFIVSSFSGKAVSPTKQAEVMSLGLPIVVNQNLGDTDSIVLNTKTGFVADDFSDETLSQVAQDLLAFIPDKDKFRKTAENYFSLISGVEKYENVYQKI